MKKLLKVIKEIAIRVYVFVIFPSVCIVGFFGFMALVDMLFEKL